MQLIDSTSSNFLILVQVQTYEEHASQTWQELFSNFGGVVGMMSGSSVLSFIEVLVYLLLVIVERFMHRR